MKPHERRYQAGRPYYRPPNKHQVSKREDFIATMAITFAVGAMLGAVITLAAVTTGVL